MIRRLLPLLVLAAVCAAWSGASAQDRPGECVTRRVTGPDGAYRWERVACEVLVGWSRDPRALELVDGPLRGDRYGGWSVAISNPAYPGREGRPSQDDRLDAPYPTYRVAGHDADGFLAWPGKSP